MSLTRSKGNDLAAYPTCARVAASDAHYRRTPVTARQQPMANRLIVLRDGPELDGA